MKLPFFIAFQVTSCNFLCHTNNYGTALISGQMPFLPTVNSPEGKTEPQSSRWSFQNFPPALEQHTDTPSVCVCVCVAMGLEAFIFHGKPQSHLTQHNQHRHLMYLHQCAHTNICAQTHGHKHTYTPKHPHTHKHFRLLITDFAISAFCLACLLLTVTMAWMIMAKW